MIGVKWQTLDGWITKGSEPTLGSARRLAKFMGWTLERLAAAYDDADISHIIAPRQATATLTELRAGGGAIVAQERPANVEAGRELGPPKEPGRGRQTGSG